MCVIRHRALKRKKGAECTGYAGYVGHGQVSEKFENGSRIELRKAIIPYTVSIVYVVYFQRICRIYRTDRISRSAHVGDHVFRSPPSPHQAPFSPQPQWLMCGICMLQHDTSHLPNTRTLSFGDSAETESRPSRLASARRAALSRRPDLMAAQDTEGQGSVEQGKVRRNVR